MKYLFYIIPIGLIIVGVLLYKESMNPVVIINGSTIPVEVMDTDAKRQAGLSGRSNLIKDTGMLFIFPDASKQVFWNKDMRFPINVVWINGRKVVGVDSLPVDSGDNIRVFAPEEIDKVLEINQGDVDMFGIKTGDVVDLNNLNTNAL